MGILIVILAIILLVGYFVWFNTSKDDLSKANVSIDQQDSEAKKIEVYAVNNGDLDAPDDLVKRGEALHAIEDNTKLLTSSTPAVQEIKPKRSRKPAAMKATSKVKKS